MGRVHATVFVGGHPPRSDIGALVAPGTTVIAADSGWHHAVRAGLTPAVLVGDLDSIGESGLAAARTNGCEIIRHRVDKEATDAELAMLVALERGATGIDVVSGSGDRPDHVLALLHVLASPVFDGIALGGWLGESRLLVCRPGDPVSIPAAQGDTVSLVPIGGDATVSVTGMRWPLEHSVLKAHSSRGVSNIATAEPRLTVLSGRLIVFVDGRPS